MTPDAILALLKVVGAVMGGLLGIAGLLVNFKRRGRLTNGGKVVLTGIVFSAIVGVSTSVVEIDKARKEAAEQALRTETLLHEISKTLQPITKLEATYWIEFSPRR